jgi:putative peptidoglycan lipid II flippase
MKPAELGKTVPLDEPMAPAQQCSAVADEGAGDTLASMARGSWVVAAWTLVGRITGFGRLAITAAVLGPTYFGNLFQFTSAMPFLIYRLLSGSLVPAMLVPPLVGCIDNHDQAGARRLANGFLGTIMAVMLVVGVLGVLGAPLALWAMTAAVQDGEVRREQLRLGWPLMAMVLPQLLFYAISGVCAAVQQARGRFALPAVATAVENVGVIAVIGASALLYGTGTEIRDVSNGQILLLGLGATAAVGLCAALQWRGACRAGLCLIPFPGWRDPDIRRMFKMGASSVGYTSLSNAAFFGMLTIAGSAPGGVAAFQIAYSFVQLPSALIALPLAQVQLPQLSRYFREGMLREFGATYRSAVSLVLFAMLPASLLLVTIPETFAQAAAFGAMASPAGVSLTAACVAGMGLSALGEAVILVGTWASYARRDAVSPLLAMTLLLAVSIAGMVLARTVVDPPTMVWTLGASCSAASTVAGLYLHSRQIRSLLLGAGHDVRTGAANLLTAAVAMVPAWLFVHRVAGVGGGPWGGLEVASVATLAAGVTYLTLRFALGSEEIALLLPLLAKLRQGLRQRRDPRATAPPRMPVDTRP